MKSGGVRKPPGERWRRAVEDFAFAMMQMPQGWEAPPMLSLRFVFDLGKILLQLHICNIPPPY